jgi:hypothetical protein
MSWLAERCPRLARAHRNQRILLAARASRAAAKRGQILRLEQLVAHRELQLIRAGSTGSARYLQKRAAKLQSSTTALEHVRADLRAVDRWEPKGLAA